MSKYRGPRLKKIRLLGKLPGLTNKISKKLNPPGQHGSIRKKVSQFRIRLQEKQKLRFNYGISEKQLINYIKKSRKSKGSSGTLLMNFLEMRLDNIIFRLGLAPTIPFARQIINHRHILINNMVVTKPNFQCKSDDIIKVSKKKKSQQLIKKNVVNQIVPRHLYLDKDKLEGKVINLVDKQAIVLAINELLVIEYYSRKV